MTGVLAPDPVLRDEMWRLRADFVRTGSSFRTVLVTGPNGGEGVTTIAIHYGVAASELDRARVVLVDGDLRDTALTQRLGAEKRPGLRDWDGNGPLPVYESQICPGLFILPAGLRKDRSVAFLVATGIVKKARTELLQAFDEVIWDTSPIGQYPDAKMLVPSADGVILVAESDHTPIEAVKYARDQITGVRGTVIAAIRNRAGRYALGLAARGG